MKPCKAYLFVDSALFIKECRMVQFIGLSKFPYFIIGIMGVFDILLGHFCSFKKTPIQVNKNMRKVRNLRYVCKLDQKTQ